MKNTATFTAKTSKETFPVIVDNKKMTMEIKGVTVKAKTPHGQDGKFGIRINMQELSKALDYVPCMDKEVIIQLDVNSAKEYYEAFKEKRNYSGQTVNSGLGFAMKDTKHNWNLCEKLGYDAIEYVK